jgi:PilZ domain
MGPNRSRWSYPPPPPAAGTAPAATPAGQGQGAGQSPRATDAPFRAHARKTVRLTPLATHLQAGWQKPVLVENIGLGGARIKVDHPLAIGDVVTLSFTAPTLWDPLVLTARVKWVASGVRPWVAAGVGPGVASGVAPGVASGVGPGVASGAASAAGPRAAGVAFEHKATDAVFALYELIVTLGYE